MLIKKYLINKSLNNINYNLSYDFISSCIGINAIECYPLKDGFHIIDENKKNYILVKVLKEELVKYNDVFNILDNFKNNGINVSQMYSKDEIYFYDSINNEYYIVFDLNRGVYKKWSELEFDSIEIGLNRFYKASKNILKNLYSFNLKEDVNLLTIGNEIKLIDESLGFINNIGKVISIKENRSLEDILFEENKNYIENNLLEAREFFSSKSFKDYCEDCENIRFINGNLSNKSFLFNDNNEFLILNFKDSSIDLFVKDIAILIYRSISYVDNLSLSNFIKSILNEFKVDKLFNINIIINYLKIYDGVLKWFYNRYIQDQIYKNRSVEDKIKNIELYKEKKQNFIENYLCK